MNTSPRPDQGLIAVSARARIPLPLKGVKGSFIAVGGFVEVRLVQIYRQEHPEALDCLYQFPVPADGAVFQCEIRINERTIRAQVEERDAARELARAKQKAGHRTALVEVERDNLFTLSLGNVQAGDLIQVELAYFQPLRRLGGLCSVEVPLCPGVRYIPGEPLLRTNRGRGTAKDTDAVPDASRISPPRITEDHPDAAFIDVEGRIEAAFANFGSAASPSHIVDLKRTGDWISVTLRDGSEVPDRDFVVRWSEEVPSTLSPRAWVHRDGSDAYALLEIRAPRLDPGAEVPPQDVYFLVDRSGSMAGEKWVKAVEALQACVRVLGPADRAMITVFSSGQRNFAEKPLTPAELLSDKEFLGMAKLGTEGGTELKPALEAVVSSIRRHSQERRTNLVLVTDAQVGNEPAILEVLRSMPGLPVHCFGIDVTLNDALLIAIARQQGGTFHSLHPGDDIPAAVGGLGRVLGQPVLVGMDVGPGWELAAPLPDLYAGQVHYAAARGRGDAELRVTGRNGKTDPVTLGFAAAPAADRVPFLHWAKTRIDSLLARDAHDADAIRLSKAANLICRATAFVAWDGAERVAVASREIFQPNQAIRMEGPLAMLQFALSRPTSRADCARMDPPEVMACMEAQPDSPARPSLPAPLARVAAQHLKSDVRNQLLRVLNRIGGSAWDQVAEQVAQWVIDVDDSDERSRRRDSVRRGLELLNDAAGKGEPLRSELRSAQEALRHLLDEALSRIGSCAMSSRDFAQVERLVEEMAALTKRIRGMMEELARLEQRVLEVLQAMKG